MTSLSVIMPCHNVQTTVGRAIEALQAQELQEGTFEVVVVDDGSTDGTVDAIHSAQSGPQGGVRGGAQVRPPAPLRIVRQENRGLAAARNRGASEASGEVLLFLDPDVWAAPSLVAAHLKHYNKATDRLAVQGHTTTDPQAVTTLFMRTSNLSPDFTIKRKSNLSPFHVQGRNFSVGRQAFTAVGGFDEGFTGYGWEDIELAIRLRRAGVRIILEPQARGLHHHPLSIERAARRQFYGGQGAVYFWRKHKRANGIGLALEIHPVLLPLKWLVYRTKVLGHLIRRILPWAERKERLWVCNECYQYLLWESFYGGVFSALRRQ